MVVQLLWLFMVSSDLEISFMVGAIYFGQCMEKTQLDVLAFDYLHDGAFEGLRSKNDTAWSDIGNIDFIPLMGASEVIVSEVHDFLGRSTTFDGSSWKCKQCGASLEFLQDLPGVIGIYIIAANVVFIDGFRQTLYPIQIHLNPRTRHQVIIGNGVAIIQGDFIAVGVNLLYRLLNPGSTCRND